MTPRSSGSSSGSGGDPLAEPGVLPVTRLGPPSDVSRLLVAVLVLAVGAAGGPQIGRCCPSVLGWCSRRRSPPVRGGARSACWWRELCVGWGVGPCSRLCQCHRQPRLLVGAVERSLLLGRARGAVSSLLAWRGDWSAVPRRRGWGIPGVDLDTLGFQDEQILRSSDALDVASSHGAGSRLLGFRHPLRRRTSHLA